LALVSVPASVAGVAEAAVPALVLAPVLAAAAVEAVEEAAVVSVSDPRS
jgi:hypothetical protein